ncbi:hypothetical protein [Nocardia nova]|uniref:hypothetical protein n=1 Tax=Nocardia nova TaxID=37330 RepID=UPI000CEA4581|nr:hypothetical protein [Nocardia nova]PPI89061.1 hypothetical protein C5E46_35435 [Nocardia nova]
MNWKKRVVPDEVTTDDVMDIFGWSRSEVSRRRRSGDLPEPDPWRGSERKPRWSRQTIVETLTRLGRLDGVVLAAFEGTADAPVRWSPAQAGQPEQVRLPEMSLRGDTERTHLYRVVRYLRRDAGPTYADVPEYQLCLCIAVDDPNPQRVFNALLVRSEIAHALGYGTGEAGTIAVILPADDGRPQLWFARIPKDFPPDHVISLEQVPADRIPVAAHLLGHPLPAWTEREITRSAAALWNPQQWASEHAAQKAPTPVTLAVPRALTKAHAFNRGCEVAADRIESGTLSAAAEVAQGLRGLSHKAWEAPLSNMRRRPKLPEGWTWMFQLPDPPHDDQHLHIVDTTPALQWLAASPDAPADVAEFATRYFGYDESTAVAVVDLDTLTPETRSAIDKALRPVDTSGSWLRTVLDQALDDQAVTGERQQCQWSNDSEPDTHPAVRVGQMLAFHIPRTAFPLSVPVYVEAAPTADSDGHVAVVVDIDGGVTPLPLHPGDIESLGAALTAAVWAPDATLYPGSSRLIGTIPPSVRQLIQLLRGGEPLRLDWDELTAATGTEPAPHDPDEVLYLWRAADPD